MPLVDRHDAAEAAGHVVEQLLNRRERDAQGSEVGGKRAADVVKLPVRNSALPVECLFRLAPSVEDRGGFTLHLVAGGWEDIRLARAWNSFQDGRGPFAKGDGVPDCSW